ncbi:MAG: hypothetical protein ACYCQI_11175 [Gammaproteobacteria bacterium]
MLRKNNVHNQSNEQSLIDKADVLRIENQIQQYQAARDKLVIDQSPEFREDLKRILNLKNKLKNQELDPNECSVLKEIDIALHAHAQEVIDRLNEYDECINKARAEASRLLSRPGIKDRTQSDAHVPPIGLNKPSLKKICKSKLFKDTFGISRMKLSIEQEKEASLIIEKLLQR